MQSPKPNIHYRVSVESLAAHTFSVELTIAHPTENQILSMPAWIPGSYMIRDFAKNVISLRATNQSGQQVSVIKLDKQQWQLTHSNGPITVSYQIYAYDLSVRGAYINDLYAFFNGTNMFLCVEGQQQQPHAVTLVQPELENTAHWQVATTLPSSQPLSHQFGEYWAGDYAELIDHPVLLGEFDILPFSTSGVDFELILAGGHQADTERMVRDLKTVCEHQLKFFGDTSPVSHYQFITLLTDSAFGGLEHISSTALMYSRNDLPSLHQNTRMEEGYQTFLSLCSHEFFHTWHVKRIKPLPLVDAKLDRENYTEQLWIYEGFTSYYDDISLLRCGLVSQDDYLKTMSKNLTRLVRNQGRFKQSITDSSFDAWTKFYKQDEGAVNNIVSYYNKGAVLALCLDLLIKQHSQNKYSLDNVMRFLWQAHGKTGIGTDNQVIHNALTSQFGINLDEFLHSALYTTDELPFAALLNQVGITVTYSARHGLDDKGGSQTEDNFIFDFGAQCSAKDTGLLVQTVSEGSAAFDAGLMAKDHIIALEGWQLTHANLKLRLNNLVEGQRVDMTILRDKRLLTLSFTPRLAPKDSISLQVNDQTLCNTWLGG
jgi:predicted metalloprotease with PDZ domain